MTIEEIKATQSMLDVAGRYGLYPDKKGFIRCPFHGEKTASLKLYDKSFYCFGCNKGGDIFKFVQLIEDCNFKKAFEILGGTYNHEPVSNKVLNGILKRQREQQAKEKKRAKLNAEYIEACEKLHYYQKAIDYAPRDSEIYATALKESVYLEYLIDELFNELAQKD